MAQHPFPGPGHDGDEPLPGEAKRDWAAEIDAGRIEVPPEEEEPPGVTVCLGDAGLGELAVMAEELGMALTCSHYTAGHRMELADGLSRRLPATFAGMADGSIDGYKAKLIYEYTRFLPDEQAAQADAILAAAAPELAPAELKRKVARLEMRLDPDGVRQRKEEARTIVYLDRLRNLNPRDRLTPPCDPPDGYDEPGEDPHRGHGTGCFPRPRVRRRRGPRQ